MADDFDASGICSWWNTARVNTAPTSFDASGMTAPSVSCSSALSDTGGSSSGGTLSWLSTTDVEPASSVSGPLTDTSIPMSGFGLSPTPSSMNWNQSLLRSTSFHDMLQVQEPLNYFRQDSAIQPGHQIQMNQEQFLMGQHQQSGFPVMLQGLFDPEAKPPPQQSIYDQRALHSYQPPPSSLMMGSYQANSNDSFPKFTHLLKSSSSSCSNQLQFSNNAPFWNPSASSIGEVKSGFYPSPPPVQFVTQSFEQKPNSKSNMDSAATKKSSSSEASLKKPRIETPSPLPTFKVRKEKLGDRITALQQLVSPFGKTDTASVLHEAIEYIKFLHDQVNVLSTPYLKNGHPMQHQQNTDKSRDGERLKQDLRSRGLCLVPMEIIYPVASETSVDFWTPTFGGTYR